MTREQNEELLHRYKNGDHDALDELVSENIALVRNIAYRFCGRGTEYEDLVQIGCIGMMNAARSFDFSYNTAFSTYAVPLIIGEIRRHLRDDGQVKVSRKTRAEGVDILKKKEAFIKEHGREPKLSELCELCSLTSEELVFALDSVTPVRSLSDPVSNDENNSTLESVLADTNDEISSLTDHLALRQVIGSLPLLQQNIIHLRYYSDYSQQQTGEALGISQVKVSREEKKIIESLRCALLL